MTPEPVDDYLRQLERELRRRGIEDARLIEEAREHLADAVEEGRQHGLSIEDAEREAFERFGAPQAVAAQVFRERDPMVTRFAEVLETVWRRKWWILAPTVVTALLTTALSSYFLPTRYRSESVIMVVAPRVPAEYVRPSTTQSSRLRVEALRQQIVSRSRLETIISEFGLYPAERERQPLPEVVRQMRDDIDVSVLPADSAREDGSEKLQVSFVSSDPELAMKITERLSNMMIQESLQDRALLADMTTQFIRAQLDDVRKRIIAYEKTLDDLRAQNGRRSLSQADVLPYEVLQERYKVLLVMSEEARMTVNLERRQIGEQYRLLDPARVPERPIGPSRLGINVAGTLTGLAFGLVLVVVGGRSKPARL